ncbi:uncharacterized protein LOC119096944 [Pollicipes pollicipes]|uniref:uncharacterized protein LOC119096944 n=1 Tax=Pollicipes pollicipes TaxID=41117 RepID=UPI001884CF6F|nr:uncharacterized protein LOC119096944 [Pollicipes pollicipes]
MDKAAPDNASMPDLESWWWWSHTWWWLDNSPAPSTDDVISDCEEEQNESSLADQACDPVKMERLRIMCEDLVDDCISPLILDLSPEEFRTMQAELSHVTCWYLACDRYWDRSPAPARVLPWARIAAALTLPTLLLSYVYYLLCVLRLERRREPGKDFIQVTCPHELKRRLLERTVSREPARPRRPNDLFAIYDGDYELAPPNHVDY